MTTINNVLNTRNMLREFVSSSLTRENTMWGDDILVWL